MERFNKEPGDDDESSGQDIPKVKCQTSWRAGKLQHKHESYKEQGNCYLCFDHKSNRVDSCEQFLAHILDDIDLFSIPVAASAVSLIIDD